MDGMRLQALIYYGYAQSSQRIGLPFAQYRPTTASNPLQTVLATVLASFNAQDMKYGKPNGYGKPTWYCLADGRVLAVGDYLQGNGSTYFIAAMQPLLPILAVQCNAVVSVFRPQQQTGVGGVGYGGNTAANETTVITGFPASLLLAAKTNESVAKLPGDAKQGAWQLLMPAIVGAEIVNDDIVIDQAGTRYIVSAPELTDMGWRVNLYTSET